MENTLSKLDSYVALNQEEMMDTEGGIIFSIVAGVVIKAGALGGKTAGVMTGIARVGDWIFVVGVGWGIIQSVRR